MILAIDPGSVYSAQVLFDEKEQKVVDFSKEENRKMFSHIENSLHVPGIQICIEYPQPRGQMMTWQLVDTVMWIGQFVFFINQKCGGKSTVTKFVDRAEIKKTICPGVKSPNDSSIRSAIIDMFGGASSISNGKCPECKGKGYIGKKSSNVKCAACDWGQVPVGKLHGISSDIWQALAVAIHISMGGKTVEREQIK